MLRFDGVFRSVAASTGFIQCWGSLLSAAWTFVEVQWCVHKQTDTNVAVRGPVAGDGSNSILRHEVAHLESEPAPWRPRDATFVTRQTRDEMTFSRQTRLLGGTRAPVSKRLERQAWLFAQMSCFGFALCLCLCLSVSVCLSVCLFFSVYIYIYKSVCNCSKDRLNDRHACLNLYRCVINSINQSIPLSLWNV